MSRRSENITTNPNSKSIKSIPEMTWEEILALPTEHIPNNKIIEFRKKQADETQKKKK